MSRDNRLGRDPLRKRADFGGRREDLSRLAELSKNPARIPRDRSLSNSVELGRPRFPKLLEIARRKRDLRNFADRAIDVSPGLQWSCGVDGNNLISLLRDCLQFLDGSLKVILTPYRKALGSEDF